PPKPEKAFFMVNTTSHQVIEPVAKDIETFVKSRLPQARIRSRNLEYGPPVDSPIAIRISGEDDNTLYLISDEVKSRLTKEKGVKNVRDDWGDKSKKIIVKINQPRALRAGITNMDVAISLQT